MKVFKFITSILITLLFALTSLGLLSLLIVKKYEMSFFDVAGIVSTTYITSSLMKDFLREYLVPKLKQWIEK